VDIIVVDSKPKMNRKSQVAAEDKGFRPIGKKFVADSIKPKRARKSQFAAEYIYIDVEEDKVDESLFVGPKVVKEKGPAPETYFYTETPAISVSLEEATLETFQRIWEKGMPLVVFNISIPVDADESKYVTEAKSTAMSERASKKGKYCDWRPSFFIKYFGRETAHLVDCVSGETTNTGRKVGAFFKSFLTDDIDTMKSFYKFKVCRLFWLIDRIGRVINTFETSCLTITTSFTKFFRSPLTMPLVVS
jgi:hypothetical protein